MKPTKQGKEMKRSLLGGKHELTDHVTEKLTGYYVKVIRSNRPVCGDILASYLHCKSSDECPNHGYCPTGEDSRCFFNKAKAKNLKPMSHKNMKVYFHVDEMAWKEILSIYLDLSKDELLHRCLKGKT